MAGARYDLNWKDVNVMGCGGYAVTLLDVTAFAVQIRKLFAFIHPFFTAMADPPVPEEQGEKKDRCKQQGQGDAKIGRVARDEFSGNCCVLVLPHKTHNAKRGCHNKNNR